MKTNVGLDVCEVWGTERHTGGTRETEMGGGQLRMKAVLLITGPNHNSCDLEA